MAAWKLADVRVDGSKNTFARTRCLSASQPPDVSTMRFMREATVKSSSKPSRPNWEAESTEAPFQPPAEIRGRGEADIVGPQ